MRLCLHCLKIFWGQSNDCSPGSCEAAYSKDTMLNCSWILKMGYFSFFFSIQLRYGHITREFLFLVPISLIPKLFLNFVSFHIFRGTKILSSGELILVYHPAMENWIVRVPAKTNTQKLMFWLDHNFTKPSSMHALSSTLMTTQLISIITKMAWTVSISILSIGREQCCIKLTSFFLWGNLSFMNKCVWILLYRKPTLKAPDSSN